jgi:hypothetical protein
MNLIKQEESSSGPLTFHNQESTRGMAISEIIESPTDLANSTDVNQLLHNFETAKQKLYECQNAVMQAGSAEFTERERFFNTQSSAVTSYRVGLELGGHRSMGWTYDNIGGLEASFSRFVDEMTDGIGQLRAVLNQGEHARRQLREAEEAHVRSFDAIQEAKSRGISIPKTQKNFPRGEY